MTIQPALDALATLLYGYNYVLFLHWYDVPGIQAATIEESLKQALPHAAVDNIQTVSCDDVLRDVEDALRYAGDPTAGPEPLALQSPQFEELLERMLGHVQQIGGQATSIARFRFTQGHPAYPVFWDFAFIFIGAQHAEIFVGASSD